jgi:hypothetical protein
VTLKRTTIYTQPEEWLMPAVMPQVHHWVAVNLPPLDAVLLGISALGSGWFVALGFAVLGLLAMAKGRRDLAIILAFGVLCFPMDLLGGWIAGAALLSVIVAVHVLRVDERLQAREAALLTQDREAPRRVAVPLRAPAPLPETGSAPTAAPQPAPLSARPATPADRPTAEA